MQLILKRTFKTVQAEIPSRESAIYFVLNKVVTLTETEFEELKASRQDIVDACDSVEAKPTPARAARRIKAAEESALKTSKSPKADSGKTPAGKQKNSKQASAIKYETKKG
jgi:hypothetical protein